VAVEAIQKAHISEGAAHILKCIRVLAKKWLKRHARKDTNATSQNLFLFTFSFLAYADVPSSKY